MYGHLYWTIEHRFYRVLRVNMYGAYVVLSHLFLSYNYISRVNLNGAYAALAYVTTRLKPST